MLTARPSWTSSPPFATLLGAFAGGLVVFLTESAGHALFGTSSPNAPSTPTTGMFFSVLVGWVLGSAVGAGVASYWHKRSTAVPGLVVGALLLAGAATNITAFTHPLWMVIGAVILMPAAAWWATRRVTKRALHA